MPVSHDPALWLVGLALLGIIALGFYERRRTFNLLENMMQRAMVRQGPHSYVPMPQPAPESALPPSASRAGAGPLPPVPSGHDLSDDEVWAGVQREWAREAVELQRFEENVVESRHRALLDAQARKAAELAASGKLEGDLGQQGQSAPAGPSP